MKALSLRQPWAWLVVHGGKDIENRRWNTGFRGEFLIHAASARRVLDHEEAVAWVRARFGDEAAARVPGLYDPRVARGGIIGRARVVDVLLPNPEGPRAPWHMEEQFGFVLADVTPLPFSPQRGLLNFFDPALPGLQIEVPA